MSRPAPTPCPTRPVLRGRVARFLLTLAGVAVVGLLAAACGSSTPSASPTTTKAPAGASPGTAAPTTQVVANAMSNAKIGGMILVDAAGKTLYQFSSDTSTMSSCTGSCATAWPPLTVASGLSPRGGAGTAGTWGTITRPDGTEQVTFNGHPLYTFAGDSAAGDTNGQNVKDAGALWTVVTVGSASTPTTTLTPPPVTKAPAPTTTTTKASSGGGYGY